jgi:hypothetical protein
MELPTIDESNDQIIADKSVKNSRESAKLRLLRSQSENKENIMNSMNQRKPRSLKTAEIMAKYQPILESEDDFGLM